MENTKNQNNFERMTDEHSVEKLCKRIANLKLKKWYKKLNFLMGKTIKPWFVKLLERNLKVARVTGNIVVKQYK